jgi:hypothetical protein
MWVSVLGRVGGTVGNARQSGIIESGVRRRLANFIVAGGGG